MIILIISHNHNFNDIDKHNGHTSNNDITDNNNHRATDQCIKRSRGWPAVDSVLARLVRATP